MELCNSNCTAWYTFVGTDGGSAPEHEADPDIAGIGVRIPITLAARIITAFVASSFLTLCFALAYQILTASTSPDQNIIDYLVFRSLGKLGLFKVTREKRKFWVPVLEKMILNLSDQQLLTGLSILAAGFSTHCSISVYHFSIVGDLAWFSANIHLTTLTVLQSYFSKRPGVRNWRVIALICMAIMLLANSVMQGHQAWNESWSFNAQCLFNDLIGNWGGRSGHYAEVNIAFIIIMYSIAIVTLFENTSEFLDKWAYRRPLKNMEVTIRAYKKLYLDTESRLTKLGYLSQMIAVGIAHSVYKLVASLLNSLMISTFLDLFWFAYGVWSLKNDRDIAPDQMNGSENLLTFGQIIPLLFLSSNILTFKEIYEDGKITSIEANEKEKGTDTPYESSSQQNLIQNRPWTSTASTSSHDIDGIMSGAIQFQQDDAETLPITPRRVDTEMRLEGGSQTTGLGNRSSQIENPPFRRAATLPPSR